MARYVDERYRDIVEKTARNHLVESQVRDVLYLEEPKLPDDNAIQRHSAAVVGLGPRRMPCWPMKRNSVLLGVPKNEAKIS